jgi:gag-polypeptide of LTR copia-type
MTTTGSTSGATGSGSGSTVSSGITGPTTSSTSNSGGEVTIRVVSFTGKKDDWEAWKEKFYVRSIMKKYDNILMGDDIVPKTHSATGVKLTNLTPAEKELVEANQKGFADLVLSMDCSNPAGKVALAIIIGTKSDKELPSGNLRTAYLRLKAKYEPSTTPQLVLLTKKFHSMTLKPNQDPDVFITELEAMKVQMGELDHKIDDKTLILHILNNLTNDYSTEVRFLEQKCNSSKKQIKSSPLKMYVNL